MQKNILVVDDNELILFGLAKALRHDDYEVATAATGAAALEKLGSCKYDLCLLDVQLPDFNGLELLTFIKDMCPATKVIIMSASYFNSAFLSESIQQATANGACRFVAKPFSLCEITEVVHKVLAQDKDSLSGFHYTGNGSAKCRRRVQRRVLPDSVTFFMTLIDDGEVKRMDFEAKTIDFSEEGIGLLTSFPLKISQVIGFDQELENRSGVVVWTDMVDERTYRAGVKFA